MRLEMVERLYDEEQKRPFVCHWVDVLENRSRVVQDFRLVFKFNTFAKNKQT